MKLRERQGKNKEDNHGPQHLVVNSKSAYDDNRNEDELKAAF